MIYINLNQLVGSPTRYLFDSVGDNYYTPSSPAGRPIVSRISILAWNVIPFDSTHRRSKSLFSGSGYKRTRSNRSSTRSIADDGRTIFSTPPFPKMKTSVRQINNSIVNLYHFLSYTSLFTFKSQFNIWSTLPGQRDLTKSTIGHRDFNWWPFLNKSLDIVTRLHSPTLIHMNVRLKLPRTVKKEVGV